MAWAARVYSCFALALLGWGIAVQTYFPTPTKQPAFTSCAPAGSTICWAEDKLLGPLRRYDVYWYIGIAERGYGQRKGDTAFHPLYPALMAGVGRLLGGHYLLGGWVVAQICCIGMLTVLPRLIALDDDSVIARRAPLLMLASPLGFAFLIPYTESLLVLCLASAIYAARTRRWILAGLAGAGAALTKQPGAVVALPLIMILWEQHGAAIRAGQWRDLLRPAAGMALIPLALGGWIVYRASLGDVHFDWTEPRSAISALLVTPSYAEVWTETFELPWVPFTHAVHALATAPYFYLAFNVTIMLILLGVALASLWRAPRSIAPLTAALVLLNLSIDYPTWPYMGIIRRFTIIYPIFVQAARWTRRPLAWATLILLSLLMWLYVSAAYVHNAFVP